MLRCGVGPKRSSVPPRLSCGRAPCVPRALEGRIFGNLGMSGSKILRSWSLALLVAVTAGAAAGTRPAVVELYTSQGCSSCPPADALLGELSGRADVLALSFHVDYWDKLGWRDRFSLPAAGERQLNYVRHFGQDWVYTPDIVIDGHTDVLRVDRQELLRSLSGPRDGVPVHMDGSR
jgi:hypothetical protein